MDLCAQRSTGRRGHATGGVVLLLRGSPGRTSEAALEVIQRSTAGGWLRRVRSGLRNGTYSGSRLLGARAQKVLRSGEAHKSQTASTALERIAELYAIQEEIRGRPAEDRRAIRNLRSRPLLESFKQWLEETLGKLSRKSGTAMAVRYALARWEALLRYCDDGRLEIDNNAAERSLRAVALGRKNYLFAGSDGGGESAAAIYTLIGTAKLNGLNPESYLRNVLSRISDHPINRIGKLLPWNLAAVSADHQVVTA